MRLDPKAWEMGHSPRGFKVDWFQIVHKCTIPNLVLNKDRWGPWWFRMDSKWYGWYGYDMMWMSKELRSIVYLSTWINDFGPFGSGIHPTSLILSWGTAFFRTFRCRSFRPGIVLRKNNEGKMWSRTDGKEMGNVQHLLLVDYGGLYIAPYLSMMTIHERGIPFSNTEASATQKCPTTCSSDGFCEEQAFAYVCAVLFLIYVLQDMIWYDMTRYDMIWYDIMR